MYKKILFILLLILSFNTYAYTIYDYDVSSISVDEDYNMILKGYGRLYVGQCTDTTSKKKW